MLGKLPHRLHDTLIAFARARVGELAGIFHVGQLQWQHDIFKRVQITQQLEALEHKPDFAGAQCRTVIFVDGEQVLPCQFDGAAKLSHEFPVFGQALAGGFWYSGDQKYSNNESILFDA